MIGSYFKTAWRNLLRNKLFSILNVTGLAISMSVGLLLITFVLDLCSYDRFHKNGDSIYRITSVRTSLGNRTKFATTTVRHGRRIQQEVTGIEEATLIGNGFSQDATIGPTRIPLKGLWAEHSFFKVFTFPIKEGNPETALKDPYSIVLTESASRKLFGSQPALGRIVRFDSLDYQVTGVIKDIPFFSHLQFEVLVSLSTAEQLSKKRNTFEKWQTMPSSFVYLRLSPSADLTVVQNQLDMLASNLNQKEENTSTSFELLPLYELVVGEHLHPSEGGPGAIGPHMSPVVLWMLCGLTLVVILSACFNYANLSMARAIRRFKEIGLRKAIGANRGQVKQQFLAESILVALAALVFSFALFLVLRPMLISLAPGIQDMVKLRLTVPMVGAFVCFSILVGIVAGFMPALFFSKISAISALRNASSVRVFRYLPLRRALVVVQYTLTLIFITTSAIGYVQYKSILAFDLGYSTSNILNINMQGNNADALLRKLHEMPDVRGTSRSLIVTSIGNAWGGYLTYKDSRDSALIMTNHVDEHYLALHDYQLLAGNNFVARPASPAAVAEMIVNQQFLKRFGIGHNDLVQAIGEQVTFTNFQGTRHMRIVGVMKDFHYGKVDNLVGPVAFLPWTPDDPTIINAKIQSTDLVATRARIESAWKQIDPVHPFQAQFYDEAIQEAYSEFSSIIKIIGFLAFLAISIASMGLFGMVAYTTETRLKEISIRKVMGAGAGSLIFLLSRGFLLQLSLAALLALPVTYLVFEKFILSHFPYHTPVQMTELCIGLLIVWSISLTMIGSLTLKAAGSDPARILRSE